MNRPFHRRILSSLALAVAGAALVACGGGGSSSTPTAQPQSGTLSVGLTDAPACGFDHVYVTVEKVRVNQSATASDTDGGWSEIVLSPAQRLDLLSLSNGVLADLGQVALPAGKYTQMRLVLASNAVFTPLANAVVPTGSTQAVPLTTPSGQQSGLKMNVDIDVAANQLADVVIDFNACKSVVTAGNSGKYLLKPVLSVTPHFISGVSGSLDAAAVAAGATVSLQQGGVVVKATAPDASGKYLLQPVAPGTYDLVVTAPGKVTTVVTDVPVADGTVTPLSTTPLTLADSATGTANGTITMATTPIDATMRALQTVATGHTEEIIGGPVDATTGAYSFALPVVAANVAPYAATLAFAPAANPAQYTLEASGAGALKTSVVTVSQTTPVKTDFTLP